MVSGGMKCVKYLLVIFNFLIVLAGLTLIVAGALVQTKFNEYLSFFGGSANAAAIFLLIVGVIVFVIGFFGCCGAIKENHCMVVTFVVLLCVVLILEVAAAIVAFVLRDKITSTVEKEMMNATQNYGGKSHDGVTKAWDRVQTQFMCCGGFNFTDWKTNDYLKNTSSVPDTCCKNVSQNCGKGMFNNPARHTFIYEDGCVVTFTGWVRTNIVVVGGVAAGLTVIELIGIIIAGCLAAAIRREYEVV